MAAPFLVIIMAGKNKVSVSIALEGEQQYRQAIQNINAAQKTLRSEMKTVEQQFKSSANSLEALTSKQSVLQRQYDQQAQKVKVYEQALEKATSKEATAAERVDKLTKEYEEEQRALEKMRKTMPEATDEIAKQEQKVGELSNKLSIAQKDYLSAQNATNKYQTSLNYANVELQDLDAELKKNDGYMREAEKSADKTAHSIDEYGNEVGEAEDKTASFGKSVMAVFAGQVLHTALNKLVDGVKQVSVACVDAGTQFEAAMSKVEAVSGAAGSDMDALTEKAKQMGATTMFSASQAAEAMNYMAMAGWKTEDMLSGIDGVMNLAAASGEDLATTADIVTDALTAFGLTAQDSAHFADVLAAASSNANTNVEMMGETFKYAAPVAGSLGFSIEDTAEAIGLMANAGIKSSQAGTSLRRIMQELSGEVKIHGKALGDVVIKTTEADGSMRDLSDILADCRSAFSELSESEKASAASALVGKNAMSGFLALMNAAPADIEKLSGALDACDGKAKAMAETMQDNLAGKVTILKSALEGLAISTYDAFDDSLKEGVEGATDAITKLNDAVVNGDLSVSLEKLGKSASELMTEVVDGLVDHMPEIIDGLTTVLDNADSIVSVLKTLVISWGAYTVAVEGSQVAMKGAEAAMALLNGEMVVNPVLAVAAAFTALSVGLVELAKAEAKEGEEKLKAQKQTSSLVSETRKLTSSVKESKEAFRTSIDDINAQGAACDALVDDLINLNSQWQDSNAPGFNEAVSQQASIINELRAAYPGLNLAIDEHTGALNMDAEAIRDNIAAMQSQAYAEAAQERLTEIAKQKLELQIQQQKIAPDLEAAETALTEAQTAHAEAEERLVDIQQNWNGSIEEGTEAAMAARDAHLEAGHALAELKGENEACNTAIADLNEEEQILTENLRQNAQASSQAGASAAGASEGFTQLKLTEEELQEFIENVNKSIESQIDLLNEHQAVESVSKETLEKNLADQTAALEQWASDFESLASRGIDDGLLKQLAEMGPQAEGYIQGLLSMSESQLAEYSTKFAEATKLKAETASDITNSYLDAGTEWGEAAGEGTVTGFENKQGEVADAADESLEEAKSTAEKKTKDFEDVGESAMTATGEGVEGNADTVNKAVEKVGKGALKTAENAMGQKQFVPVGKNIALGIVEGIHSGQAEVVTAVKTMAAEAVKAANEELVIKSPSKKFEQVGAYSSEGFLVGFNSNAKAIVDSVKSTMNETLAAASSPVTSPSGLDSTGMASTIANAIEHGLAQFTLNINADVDKQAIVDITVDANRRNKIRTGASIYA